MLIQPVLMTLADGAGELHSPFQVNFSPMVRWHLLDTIACALERNEPVVALESALITHGLPRPLNLECAQELESTVRTHGAQPATIAVLGGQVKIGLEPQELEQLAQVESPLKLSLHNLPIALAQGATGGTTVAATAWIALRAGIRCMATGGIGGVHRENPHDVSADLPTLAQTDLILVCSGAKIILDLPATREWLETWGVPVLGYQTDEFPGFYTASTGLPVDRTVETVEEVITLWRAKQRLRLPGALLIVQPPPAEMAMAREEIEAILQQALRECEQSGIRGAAVTPYLLARLGELSRGRTLQVNTALLKQNAGLAAEIAKRLF